MSDENYLIFFFQSQACVAWCDSSGMFWVQQNIVLFVTLTMMLARLPQDSPWLVTLLVSNKNRGIICLCNLLHIALA